MAVMVETSKPLFPFTFGLDDEPGFFPGTSGTMFHRKWKFLCKSVNPWGGKCELGTLAEHADRTQPNHCGSCQGDTYLTKENSCKLCANPPDYTCPEYQYRTGVFCDGKTPNAGDTCGKCKTCAKGEYRYHPDGLTTQTLASNACSRTGYTTHTCKKCTESCPVGSYMGPVCTGNFFEDSRACRQIQVEVCMQPTQCSASLLLEQIRVCWTTAATIAARNQGSRCTRIFS